MTPETAETPPARSKWVDVKVFLPPNTAGPSRIPPPLSEGEPKPTPAELKQAFSGHIAQRNGPDAPLMTKAMREREEAKLGIKKREFNEIRIRVRFSDRTALEGLFPSSTVVPTLYDFIRAHLAPTYASVPFVVYQAPPRRDLPERGDLTLQGKTIKDLGMAPQAIVNIRWSEASMNGNTFPAPLLSEILSQAEELPMPPSFDSVVSSPGQTVGESEKQGSGAGDTTKKIPKWLKSLQKK
ncbi:hypothetical protein CBS101457_004740 [Exobasidium rhododendri]|nr:hypothetical protein CBS101457_004740 [Exobasidium rhododendri]